jgi:hypothetical protein
MNPIEAGKEALEAIVRPLREEKERLVERIAEIDVTLKPLEAAIGPLGGRGSRKAKPSSAARTVTQEDVRQVLGKLAAANPGASQEALVERAKQTLKVQHGLDLKGFANRCREVLRSDPLLVEGAGRVRPVDASQAPAAPTEASLRHAEPKSAVDNFAFGAPGR